MKKMLIHLEKCLGSGQSVVLAIVTQTWGSAPRQVGSLMAVCPDGSFEGSVSGGCVEGSVIAEAQHLLRTGGHGKKLSFAVSDGDAFAVGLACGGQIEISLFVLTSGDHAAISIASAALATRHDGSLLLSHGTKNAQFTDIKVTEIAQLVEQLTLPVSPPYQLMIIGAVHIAQYLSPMATECGYDVSIIDPRPAFTENRAFGEATIIQNWPDEHFSNQSPDQTTALVTLTHDPKLDDAALKPTLNSKAFYIGCLGSKKTHAARLERLRAAGFSDTDLSRLHGPVGLNIGAKNPAEIAIAILAEITAVRRGVAL